MPPTRCSVRRIRSIITLPSSNEARARRINSSSGRRPSQSNSGVFRPFRKREKEALSKEPPFLLCVFVLVFVQKFYFFKMTLKFCCKFIKLCMVLYIRLRNSPAEILRCTLPPFPHRLFRAENEEDKSLCRQKNSVRCSWRFAW